MCQSVRSVEFVCARPKAIVQLWVNRIARARYSTYIVFLLGVPKADILGSQTDNVAGVVGDTGPGTARSDIHADVVGFLELHGFGLGVGQEEKGSGSRWESPECKTSQI
jgi:hypothetical protein